MNQLNLLLRFLLEIVTLFSIGMFAWTYFNGFARYALVLILPVLVMIIWTVFAVPGDPSRGGDGIVVVSGTVRLIIEFLALSVGFISIYFCGFRSFSIIFLLLTILHYITTLERIRWLLKQ